MVQFVGATSAAANTVATPTHQAGDLIVVFAYRDGSTTAPSLPAGFININNSGANTNSGRVGYKFATSNSDTIGTWNNASAVVVHVYRNAIPGAHAVNGGSSNSLSYPSLSLEKTDNTSWVARFGGHRTATNMTTNTTSGFTQRTGVSTEIQGSDTNGTVSSLSSGSQSVNQSSGWRAHSLEIREPFPKIETFTDNFDNDSLDSRWNTYGSVSESSQTVRFSLTGGSPNYHGIYTSFPNLFDLRGSYVLAEVVDAGNQTWTSIETYGPMLVHDGDNDSRIFIQIANGSLSAWKTVGGSTSAVGTPISYNASNHKWLRIREEAGTVYWEYASQAQYEADDWQILHSEATPVPIHRMAPELGAGNWDSESGSSVVVRDSFNIVPDPPDPSYLTNLPNFLMI